MQWHSVAEYNVLFLFNENAFIYIYIYISLAPLLYMLWSLLLLQIALNCCYFIFNKNWQQYTTNNLSNLTKYQ